MLSSPALAAPASEPPVPGQPVSVGKCVSQVLLLELELGWHTAVHEVNFVKTAADVLDVAQSCSHIVEVGLCCVGDILVLPVGKAVC